MAYLKVTGMVPPEAGSYWSEGRIEIWPADRAKLDWADGGRRAIWPITGDLAGAGTRFGSTNDAGDVLVPGADIGDSVDPPVLEITAYLRDGIKGEWKEFRAVGKVKASSAGEWNINAPLAGVLQYVNTPGVPVGALNQGDVGVVVPSMAAFNAVAGRDYMIEETNPRNGVWVRRWAGGRLEAQGHEVFKIAGSGGGFIIDFGTMFVGAYALMAINGDMKNVARLHLDMYEGHGGAATMISCMINPGGTPTLLPDGAPIRVMWMATGRWK